VDLLRRSTSRRDKPWDTREQEGVTKHTRVTNDLCKGREETRFTRDNPRDTRVGSQEVKMGKVTTIQPILYTTAILGSLSRSTHTHLRTPSSPIRIQHSPLRNSCRKDVSPLNQRKARSSSTEMVAPQPPPPDHGDLFRDGRPYRPSDPEVMVPHLNLDSSAPFDPG
jgi:hypothetical protein